MKSIDAIISEPKDTYNRSLDKLLEEVDSIPLLVSATVGQIINREKMSKILSYPNL